MNLKTLFFIFILAIFAISCNESILESEPVTQVTNELKAATIGTTYYVAKTGNDNNLGIAASPFLTIQKAANIVNPGDIVIVRDGTYTATTTYIVGLSRSGTAANPIVFKSENKWGAKLDGSNNTTDSGWGFVFNNADYITLENFEIKNIGRMATYVMEGSSNIIIKGNNIHDIGRRCTDTDYGMVGVCAWKASNITIKNNIFANIGRYQPGENGCSPSNQYYKNHDHAIYFDGVAGSMINNNIFYNNKAGWAIHTYSGTGLASSNISVLNNTFAYSNVNRSGQILIYGTMSNLLIANNIFHSPTTEGINIHVSSSYTYTNCVVKNNMTFGAVTLLGPEDDGGSIKSGTPSGFTISNNFNNIDPKMVSVSTFNFKLTTASPAINTGVNVGLTNDYSGNAIIGLPDIGAYESTISNPSSTTYYNIQTSASATKNSCGTGYTGSTVTYTVSANKYSSTVSQVDANNLAIADVNNNKQAYANSLGTCTAVSTIVYYNSPKSGTATKNDCGTGYTGSVVTATVPAKYFSSTISQADADNKAITMVKDGIQAYANANGTCTKTTTYWWQR